jgi:hypothetical protein
MASLITRDYFHSDLLLPQREQEAARDELDLFIGKYEPEFLEKILGAAFYNLFNTGLGADPIAERWVWLRDGKDYVYNGENVRWRGLRNSVTKVSPIANYIYAEYVRNNVTTTTDVGETVQESKNSRRVNPVHKEVAAFNKALDIVKEMYQYLETSAEQYPEFRLSQATELFYRNKMGC